MIIYFADRQLNIIGQASTKLPRGLTIVDDERTDEIETGVSVFECTIPFTDDTRLRVEESTELGNHVILKCDDEDKLYTIIDAEIDTKRQEVYIYAEDDGMDLLNEVVGPYEADKAYNIAHYINMYAADAGFEIGINEVSDLTRKLSWGGESTATARIASVATQFGGCEVSYSFTIDKLNVAKKYINIYKERGKDVGITLRLNQDIDKIITKKSIANLATALQCTGGTPEDTNTEDDVEPTAVTLKGYSYDDGDFYVDSDGILKSRKALERWNRFLWKTDDTSKSGGHIVKQYSYDTIEQKTLCSNAITELKKICDMEVNYEADISKFPDSVKIGDRINIVDDRGELYLSTRVLKLQSSETNQERIATFGEYLIKSGGIAQKVIDLADQFSKNAQNVLRALVIANNAKGSAEAAQKAAIAAAMDAYTAQQDANNAQISADSVLGSATDALEKANAVQSAVNKVEESVSTLETTVSEAQTAAEQARQAAATADAKAEEAKEAAEQALADAEDAKQAAETAQSTANTATTKAEEAKSTADVAKTDAATAQATAEAAKADAEQAQKDIDDLKNSLETITNTMTADYTRKTDLTEATASLKSQISQNAAEINSAVSQISTIDETANNAQSQAQAAQTAAATAQAQANQATADAQAAQTAADEAAAAATAAQNEADTAKTAAATAQSVADKAEADLETAKKDLATVTSRVDSTEEEIVAAQKAVEAAQTAADAAKANAQTATEKANEAQSTANTAASNASDAQTVANNAASQAALAQQVADEAKGNAEAAQTRANEAATIAAEAQRTANTAVTDAANAQARANAAVQAAAEAQAAADDADAKAAAAAEDLATAKQNLVDVVGRVDATEAEVEEAKNAVISAQAAADRAQEEAEAAQATADTAKANAATAQTAADNAKTAADEAQATAAEAQKAADDAQAAVDALAVRVTTAETKITQNTEQIALMAKKTEVERTLDGYYKKEETEAAIQLESDSIKSSVSSTYATKQEVEDIEVGGRNLIPSSEWVCDVTTTGFAWNRNTQRVHVEVGETYTLSCYYNGVRTTNQTHGYAYVYAYDSNDAKILDGDYMTTSDGVRTKTVTEANLSYVTVSFGIKNCVEGDVYAVKLEKGNKATDWTPAPEDVDGAIDAAQTTADDASESATAANERVTTAESLIQQLSNCIAMLVTDENGESLMTQTDDGWTFSMKETNEAVSSLTSLLETVQQETGDTQATVEVLRQAVSDHGATLEYVTVTTYEGEPCIELGESDSDFKLLITNTRIMFVNGSNVPTYINTNGLVTQNIEVKGEIVQGGYVMINTSDGGWGLLWKGVSG